MAHRTPATGCRCGRVDCAACTAYRSNVAPANTAAAVQAVTTAARGEHDFGGWLAAVLAAAAAELGSSDELTAGRPGSWEAALVDQLVKGTVGYDDSYLAGYRS